MSEEREVAVILQGGMSQIRELAEVLTEAGLRAGVVPAPPEEQSP
jgi:hypothetical protein